MKSEQRKKYSIILEHKVYLSLRNFYPTAGSYGSDIQNICTKYERKAYTNKFYSKYEVTKNTQTQNNKYGVTSNTQIYNTMGEYQLLKLT